MFPYFGVLAIIGAAIAAAYTVETKNRTLEAVSADKS